MSPNISPILMEMLTETTATRIEIFAPENVRINKSRPRSSVPNQLVKEGASASPMRSGLNVFGSVFERNGKKIAKKTRVVRNINDSKDNGFILG